MASMKGMENDGKMPRFTYLRSIFKAILFTLIMFLVLAAILTFTSVPDNILPITTSILMILSIAYSGILTAIRKEKNGFIQGVITGSIYVLLVIFLCWALVKDFSLDKNVLIKSVMGVLAGGIGGMIGVNFK